MTKLINHPRLEILPRAELKPDPNNPRTHPDKQLTLLAKSIRRLGFLVPVVIDDDDIIVAGNARWEAAGRLGMTELPCIRARFLSDADRRAFSLAENRLSELAGWDQTLLSKELEFLVEQDYDLDITGFDFSHLDGACDAGVDDEVELPAPDGVAVSRPGDLWRIGAHRLLCGNAREVASYETLLGDETATMVFADPPYNVRIDRNVSGLGRNRHREFAEASGEMNPALFTGFLRTVFRHLARFSADGSIHYQCMDWRHMREMLDALEGIYTLKQLVTWVKDNAGMGTFYRSRHELIFVFKSGGAPHINNFGLGDSGRYRTNVWEYAGANSFRKGRAADLADHPTVKPQAMVADAILDCSRRGDIVLDPFSGSGTTLAAAHRTGRRGAAIEIDPLYVDVALRRLTKASGLTATLSDGRGFDEVVADRMAETTHG